MGPGLFRPGPKTGRLCWTWSDPEQNGWLAALTALSNGRIGLRASFPGSSGSGEPGAMVSGLIGRGRDYERAILALIDPLWWQVGDRVESLEVVLDTGHGWVGIAGRVGPGRLEMRWAVPQHGQADVVYREILASGPLRLSVNARWLEPRRAQASNGAVQVLAGRPGGASAAVAAATTLVHLGEGTSRAKPECFEIALAAGQSAHLLQVTAIATASVPDAAVGKALVHLDEAVQEAQTRISNHQADWRAQWAADTPQLDPPGRLSEGLVFGTFHLAQLPDRAAPTLHYGPRGLTHRRYGGLGFLNTDLYLIPYFATQEPDIAARLLAGRLSGLDAALHYAAATGWPGARYPLVAAVDGRPVAACDPTRQAIADSSHHMTANVIWAARAYHLATGTDAAANVGTARLCRAAAPYLHAVLQRAETMPMTGYDEFHPSVRGQWATRAMAAGALGWIAGTVDAAHPTALGPPVQPFDGWSGLADRRAVYPQGEALPRLDESELALARANAAFPTQLMKQADPLVPMVLWPENHDREALARAYHLYERRTAHASSLSPPIHALAAARLGDASETWRLLAAALRYNLDFRPQEGYANGVHLAGYAGAWWTILRGIVGFDDKGILCEGHRPLFNEEIEVISGTIWSGGRKLRFESRRTGTETEEISL